MADCSVDGCEKKARKRGMCPSHYWVDTHPTQLCSAPGCDSSARTNGMCNKHNCAAWRAEGNRGKRPQEYYSPEATQDRNLRHNYGIGRGEWLAMVEAQGGVCKICGRAPKGKGRNTRCLHVDHDHVSGVIRGLLCIKCNVMLGKSEDSTATLQKAIDYLLAAR